jgi:N6-L-threonylcarbamoyladenine synthase
MRVDGVGRYELLGETIDDAAGEAFDNRPSSWAWVTPAARRCRAWPSRATRRRSLPRPLLHSGNLDFSFAGLKTAVLTQARKLGDELEARKADGRARRPPSSRCW